MSHKGPTRFSDAEDDLLISCVSRYPAIYIWRHQDFRNAKVKSDIWEIIAASVARDVEVCKRRWRDIKDNYFKIKRQDKIDKCRWPLAGKLAFLDMVQPERRMVSHDDTEDREAAGPSRDSKYDKGRFILPAPEILIQEQEDFSMEGNISEEGTSRKRRFDEVSMDEVHSQDEDSGRGPQEDDVDLFMRSVALQLKKMHPRKVGEAKLRILTVVNELQFGEMRLGVKKESHSGSR